MGPAETTNRDKRATQKLVSSRELKPKLEPKPKPKPILEARHCVCSRDRSRPATQTVGGGGHLSEMWVRLVVYVIHISHWKTGERDKNAYKYELSKYM
jgi:hypothetical protein